MALNTDVFSQNPAQGQSRQARMLPAAPDADTTRSRCDSVILAKSLSARKGVPHRMVSGQASNMRFLPPHPGVDP